MSERPTDTEPPAPPWRLLHLMDGFVTTQLIYVAAKLGIAELLAAGPRHADEIATAVGVAPGPLRRVLRGLVVEDVLTEGADGDFALTPIGESLPALRGAALVRGEIYYQGAAALLDSVRAGGPAFPRIYGETFFDHLDHHADHQAAFEASMAGRGAQEAEDVVAAYDFGALGRLVDVGGGRGVLLATILRAAPALAGTLLDREAVIPMARQHLETAGLADRVELVAGDFFAALPAGADAYLLSRVLHDWDDDDAARILTACRRAMTATSRLLVVEAVLPERARDAPAAIRMDLHMLLLFGALERTEAEFRQLLGGAGLEVAQVVPTGSPAGLSIIEATPR